MDDFRDPAVLPEVRRSPEVRSIVAHRTLRLYNWMAPLCVPATILVELFGSQNIQRSTMTIWWVYMFPNVVAVLALVVWGRELEPTGANATRKTGVTTAIMVMSCTSWGTLAAAANPTSVTATWSVAFVVGSVVFFMVSLNPGAPLWLLMTVAVPNAYVLGFLAPAASLPAAVLSLTLFGICIFFGYLQRWAQQEIAVASLRTAAMAEGLTAANEDLAHQASHDDLTGLANRSLFRRNLETFMAEGERTGRQPGLMFLDLDNFKITNDTLGHAVGDALLTLVARRAERICADHDAVVARVGGDEFTVLAPDTTEENMLALADRLLSSFSSPFAIDGQDVRSSATIGVAVAEPQDATDDLYRFADFALYQAKEEGRGRAKLFAPAMRQQLSGQIELQMELRQALRDSQIRAWFQPEVDLLSGEIVGAEALARWEHTGGERSAESFVAAAADARLLTEIGRQVAADVADFHSEVGIVAQRPFSVGLNVSVGDIEQLAEGLTSGVSGDRLDGINLEVTEADAVGDAAVVSKALTRLRDRGAKVLLDDFGAVHSSLSLICELPIDGIKIDCSIVSRALEDRKVRGLISAMVELASHNDLFLVAEGVETQQQANVLIELGVRRGQGFLFAPAVKAEQLLDWIADDTHLSAGVVQTVTNRASET